MPSLKICTPNLCTTICTTYSWSALVSMESNATPTAIASN